VEECQEGGANTDTFENWVKQKDKDDYNLLKGGNYVIEAKHNPKNFKGVIDLFLGSETLDHSGSIFDNDTLYPKELYDSVKKDTATKKQIKRDK